MELVKTNVTASIGPNYLHYSSLNIACVEQSLKQTYVRYLNQIFAASSRYVEQFRCGEPWLTADDDCRAL
jgi:hypothetical protein